MGVEAVLEDIVVGSRKGDRAEFIAELVDFVEFIRLVSFRCLTDQDGSLVTDFPQERGLTCVVDAEQTQQWYIYPGTAMALLAQLYASTSETRYLEAADRFFEFTRRCREDFYRVLPAGRSSGVRPSCTH